MLVFEGDKIKNCKDSIKELFLQLTPFLDGEFFEDHQIEFLESLKSFYHKNGFLSTKQFHYLRRYYYMTLRDDDGFDFAMADSDHAYRYS